MLRTNNKAVAGKPLGFFDTRLVAPTVEALTKGLDELEDLETCDLPLAVACREALALLPHAQAGAADDAPFTWEELAQSSRNKVQKQFTRRFDSTK